MTTRPDTSSGPGTCCNTRAATPSARPTSPTTIRCGRSSRARDRRSAGVVERRRVSADAGQVEHQWPVGDLESVGDQLLADAIVARDNAADGLRPVVAVADTDGDVVTDAQPLA